MNKMNPIYPSRRGCFLDRRTEGKVIVVDYPTWSNKNGRFVIGDMNAPIPEGEPFEKEFKTIGEAVAFANEENYVICTDPWMKPKFEKRKTVQDDIED